MRLMLKTQLRPLIIKSENWANTLKPSEVPAARAPTGKVSDYEASWEKLKQLFQLGVHPCKSWTWAVSAAS